MSNRRQLSNRSHSLWTTCYRLADNERALGIVGTGLVGRLNVVDCRGRSWNVQFETDILACW